MPVLDQIETFGKQEFTSSYTDIVVNGTIVTGAGTPFSRQKVADKNYGLSHNFTNKNYTYADRLRFLSGSRIGSPIQNLFLQQFAFQESYYDSYLPSPVSIAQKNNVIFPYLEASGALSGSAEHGIRATSNNTIGLFLADSTNISNKPNIKNYIDITWSQAKWPFRSRYKTLDRIFKLSFDLPEQVNLTERFSNGETVSPPIKSNKLGNLYLVVSNCYVDFNFPQIQTVLSESGKFNPKRRTPQFADGDIRAVAYAPPSVSSSTDSRGIYCAIGRDGNKIHYSNDGILWNAYHTNVAYATTNDARGITYSVNSSNNFVTWIIVNSNKNVIYLNTSKNPKLGSWTTATLPSQGGHKLYSVAYNNPQGDAVASNFVVAGESFSGGIVQTSTDETGTSWNAEQALGTVSRFWGITFNTASNNFIAVGTDGFGGNVPVYTSNNRAGTAWTLRATPVTGSLRAVASNGTTCIAVGVSNNNGIILRSTNSGVNWTLVKDTPPLGSVDSTYYAVSPGRTDDNIDWIVVGNRGQILVSKDNGINWETVIPDSGFDGPDAFGIYREFFGVNAIAVNPVTNTAVNGERYVLVGDGQSIAQRDIIFRATDLVSNTYASNSLGIFVHETNLLRQGLVKANSSDYIKSTPAQVETFYKTYFGNHKGLDFNLSASWGLNTGAEIGQKPSTSKGRWIRDCVPGFRDFEYFDLATGVPSIETIRVYDPIVSQWGYGIYNAIPTFSKMIFKRNHFGHFRDILEQRPYTKFLLASKRSTVQQAAVNINFVSGTLAYQRARDYLTASNPSYNPTDSGQFDFEYKAGQPFFDNIDLNQYR